MGKWLPQGTDKKRHMKSSVLLSRTWGFHGSDSEEVCLLGCSTRLRGATTQKMAAFNIAVCLDLIHHSILQNETTTLSELALGGYPTGNKSFVMLMFWLFADTYDVVDLDMEIGVLFHRLARRLREEEQLTEELLSLQGAIQLLLSGAGVGESDNTGSRTSVTNIQPSQSAQSNFIVNLTWVTYILSCLAHRLNQ